MDTTDIRTEMDRVRADFGDLVYSATVRELRRHTAGTKWTNEHLLFHMVFGYLLVRNLIVLVRGFSRLPDEASRRFAATLNAGTRPLHTINSAGSASSATRVPSGSWTDPWAPCRHRSTIAPTPSPTDPCTSRSAGTRTSKTS
jgi:hypothetical protein